MIKKPVRVRFAPAPTGFMHLGNVRTALLNYLFAKKHGGIFIIRLEDTDPDRNFDPNGKQILSELKWLHLSYQEGPDIGGPYIPYQQSLRTNLYQEALEDLQKNNHVYRCFCSEADLQKKRERAIALKQAPRYDRICLKLTHEQVQENLSNGLPFIFRFKVPQDALIEVNELSRGLMKFEGKNFSDFPITRSDGTFTFIFANVVDDMLMKITHVIRGEDHLSNTANQVMMYNACGKPAPAFWHLPILCNVDGKKLSKRDFGFALKDLIEAGYVPEAIDNYLAIIGGSFEKEIMPLEELAQTFNFEDIKTTGNIKYDVDKLRWMNHKWIQEYTPEKLTEILKPLLIAHYPQIKNLDHAQLVNLVQGIKSELTVLKDAIPALNFYFEAPILTRKVILEHIPEDQEKVITELLQNTLAKIENVEAFVEALKAGAKEHNIKIKLLFTTIRLLLTGSDKGPSIHELINLLGTSESKKRIEKFLK